MLLVSRVGTRSTPVRPQVSCLSCVKADLRLGMGLTPLEGLIGGTRCGTIDPTAVFHLLKDPGADGGADGMKVSKAELTLNK